jgi:hypothetical protein
VSSPVALRVEDAQCTHCGAHVVVAMPTTAADVGEAMAAIDRAVDAHIARCPNAPKELAAHG